MKVGTRRRAGPLPVRQSDQAHTYSLSQAKTYLGRLVEKALQGQTVYITRGQQRFTLQHIPEIEPIPIRPPGYFAYSKDEIELEKQLEKASAVEPPEDLE